MGYAADWYKLRTGEVLTSVFLQSKLVDAEKIIANAMNVRKDIGGIITRLNLLKSKAKSKNKTGRDIDTLEKGLLSFVKDESFRIFAMIESNMLLLHDLTEFLHEVVRINHEISKEKVAQSSVKINIPTIANPNDAKKAKQQMDAAKKKVETATKEGRKLLEIKTAAARSVREIKGMVIELKREMLKFRNQFDSLRRFELR